jgi:hypothetical protein
MYLRKSTAKIPRLTILPTPYHIHKSDRNHHKSTYTRSRSRCKDLGLLLTISGQEQLWGESDNRFRLVLAHPVANGRP